LNSPLPIPVEKLEEPPQSSIPKQLENESAEEKSDGAPSPPKKVGTKTKPGRKSKDTTTTAAEASQPIPSPPPISAAEQARIVFGSRLAGPAERAERLADMRSRSTLVAGILVPPKPDEPDNCCMSGCVNCVWDRYREELEEWSLANSKAQKRLRVQHGERPAISMDDDGGGSESTWDVGLAKITKDLWDDELYRDLPVGIREFMRQEKRLKERHAREGTVGG
jgi:Oxidoreductase-like protein, N-terminal